MEPVSVGRRETGACRAKIGKHHLQNGLGAVVLCIKMSKASETEGSKTFGRASLFDVQRERQHGNAAREQLRRRPVISVGDGKVTGPSRRQSVWSPQTCPIRPFIQDHQWQSVVGIRSAAIRFLARPPFSKTSGSQQFLPLPFRSPAHCR